MPKTDSILLNTVLLLKPTSNFEEKFISKYVINFILHFLLSELIEM